MELARLPGEMHGSPEAGDAERVRQYAAAISDIDLGARYDDLAEFIEAVYAAEPLPEVLAEARAPVGAVACFLLSAANAFEAGNAVEICSGHSHGDPTPPSRCVETAIPPELEGIVLQCLARAPADRPASAAALDAALAACEDAGSWQQAEARAWWQEHGADASGLAVDEAAPMSRTEMLIDMDTRLRTGKS